MSSSGASGRHAPATITKTDDQADSQTLRSKQSALLIEAQSAEIMFSEEASQHLVTAERQAEADGAQIEEQSTGEPMLTSASIEASDCVNCRCCRLSFCSCRHVC